MPLNMIAEFDRLIRRDPARRGLISSEEKYGPLCVGHLAEAALHLANNARMVGIVTGFFIPDGDIPAAETDGPLGALVLAVALEKSGIETFLLTDHFCEPAVLACAEVIGYPREKIVIAEGEIAGWLDKFQASDLMRSCSHLISVERAGPAHTEQSLQRHPEHHPDHLEEFLLTVPVSSHNRCHNMRGRIIDEHTPELHCLFDELPRRWPHVKTVGIGDGANEIGMGAISWKELSLRVTGEAASRIPCRIPTDWNIVAGTSNWGAYALAAAFSLLRQKADSLQNWTGSQQLQMLTLMVERGPAVDGVTGKQEATVDGLPFPTFIQPWLEMRRLLGLID
ncbi:MAG: hypothetical protein Tsb009_31390 [Planctomycetaceae bacterium]